MPQLFLALDGRIDFIRKTNPFGVPEKKQPDTKAVEAGKVALDAINARAKMKIGTLKNG